MRKICLLGIAGFLSACGGSNPVNSGVDAHDQAAAVTVLDGRTGEAITSTSSLVGHRGEVLQVTMPRFLGFRTTWQGGPLTLWPMDDYLSLEYTRALAYSQYPDHIMRFAPGITYIGLQPVGVLAEGKYLQEIGAAADLLSRAHDVLDYGLTEGQVMIPISIDPDDPVFQGQNAAGAAYSVYDERGVIDPTKSRIVFRSADIDGYWHGWDNFRIAVAHELAHTTGLMHIASGKDQGIMSADPHVYSYRDFTDREKLTMHMTYLRRPGTTLSGTQEDDTSVGSLGRWMMAVVVD